MTAKRIVDPEKYAAMSKPFPSKLELEAAVAEFTKGVRALREKHKITDVYVVIAASALPSFKPMDEKGEEEETDSDGPMSYVSTFSCGSSDKALPMVAAAYGFEKSKHDEMIEELVNGTRRSPKDKQVND